MGGLYKMMGISWKTNSKIEKEAKKSNLIKWRKEGSFERIERPTRINRARALGYKTKKGFVVVRARILRGGRKRPLYGRKGRKPSKSGLSSFTSKKSLRWIAEERVQKKFKNLEVLGSYHVGQDGRYKWFEVILVDPKEPTINKDKNLKWISKATNRKRVFRGLTAAGKKSRGL